MFRATLELFVDVPIREPYIAYIQDRITIEHIKFNRKFRKLNNIKIIKIA